MPGAWMTGALVRVALALAYQLVTLGGARKSNQPATSVPITICCAP